MRAMQTVTTRDGLKLFVQPWPLAAARGHLHIVHGLGEHIGRYEALAHALNALGWSVSGHDQRGHGRSDGARGAIAAADSLCDDLSRVLDSVRAEWRGRLVLLGHSMGGLVAARFVAEALAPQPAAWSRAVGGLVLSSPALAVGMNALQQALLAVLGRVAPDVALGNGLKPAWISRDPAVVRAYVEDPLVHDRVTPRLVRFIVDGGEAVRKQAARWRTPTLLMWAGADRCVAPRGSAAFAAAAPGGVLQHREFAALAHEIFNEPEREQVIAHLARWLAEPRTGI
jgi:alpha-beta hydrolase superfamily lysophospholipase